ncbi:hypothetical protein FSP39_023013 [Pinctada imbricata]|uniref:Uncharacterized protein n=1 Tax=Pinctada imbricata TaxID=66713 RepID=A0AA88XDV0_PINIB|nr:hypothetical protein FSP39_023013 [Pinctada imbricata]
MVQFFYSHNRSIRSDPGSARMDQSSHPRLTAEVLASHNEKVCRQRGIMGDDIRGSTSDTEVEFMEREENIRKKSPKMRRRSISTDGQHLHDFQKSGRMGYKPQAEFRQFGQFYPNENPDEMRGQRGKGQGHPAYRYDSFPNTLSQYENISDVEQSKVSAVESRYSVTDYFKKYNANKPSGALTGNRSVNKDRTHLRSVSFRDESRLDNVNHRRSLSQPESQDVRNFSTQRNIPAQESSNYRDTIGAKSKLKSPQEKLFTGTVLDNSISAIDDDNISSVSEKTLSRSTTSTFDDKSFRKGIATLDANILKLQLALQKTKSMLT